jgi:hypothetical protein
MGDTPAMLALHWRLAAGHEAGDWRHETRVSTSHTNLSVFYSAPEVSEVASARDRAPRRGLAHS